jgi:hypothetical protein
MEHFASILCAARGVLMVRSSIQANSEGVFMFRIVFCWALACVLATLAYAEDVQIAPDGSWVYGEPHIAPDGTWVGGEPEIAPDGTWVGGDPQIAPDGAWVGGDPRIAPDGSWIGGHDPEIAPDGTWP